MYNIYVYRMEEEEKCMTRPIRFHYVDKQKLLVQIK